MTKPIVPSPNSIVRLEGSGTVGPPISAREPIRTTLRSVTDPENADPSPNFPNNCGVPKATVEVTPDADRKSVV